MIDEHLIVCSACVGKASGLDALRRAVELAEAAAARVKKESAVWLLRLTCRGAACRFTVRVGEVKGPRRAGVLLRIETVEKIAIDSLRFEDMAGAWVALAQHGPLHGDSLCNFDLQLLCTPVGVDDDMNPLADAAELKLRRLEVCIETAKTDGEV